MLDQKKLEAAGINYSKGLARFMKNAALYEKFLQKFLNDASYTGFKTALESGDMVAAEKSIHTLKGTSGNLSIENLYELADSITQKIRNGASADEIRQIAPELDSMYEKVCNAIKRDV